MVLGAVKKNKEGEKRDARSGTRLPLPVHGRDSQCPSLTFLTEPWTSVSIFLCDILIKASAAPSTILALKQVPADVPQAGVGTSHPLRCPGG